MKKSYEDSWAADMEDSDYQWLLKECKVKTNWQLRTFFVSWKGRLLEMKKQPAVVNRGTPPYSYSLGCLPYLGDGTSAGGERLKVSESSSCRPFCALTHKGGPAPVELRGLPMAEYRARVRPSRQEPEWQLSDPDVEESWRQVNTSVLGACTPAQIFF